MERRMQKKGYMLQIAMTYNFRTEAQVSGTPLFVLSAENAFSIASSISTSTKRKTVVFNVICTQKYNQVNCHQY